MKLYQILGFSLIAAAFTFLGLSTNNYQEYLKVLDKERTEPCGLKHPCDIFPAVPDYSSPMVIGLILASTGVTSFSYRKIKSRIGVK